MARLADYTASFAELLGIASTSTSEVGTGSLRVAARVDEIAQRKVDKRGR